MRISGAMKLALLLVGILGVGACKSDDPFVVGGGPAPGDSVSSVSNVTRDSSAASRDGLSDGELIKTTDGLIGDLSEPVVHVAGDTLLLLGHTMNDLSRRTLPTHLANTAVLAGDSVNLLGGVIGTTNDRINGSNSDHLLADVTKTTAALTDDLSDGALLGGVTDTTTGLVNGLSDGGGLVGEITRTAGDLTNGKDNLLSGVTNTVDGIAGGTSTNGSGFFNGLLGK